MCGSVRKARPRAMRWRCPPESVTPLLADDGVIALVKGLDEIICLCKLRRGFDLLLRCLRLSKGDVLADLSREQEDILLDHRNL